MYYKLIRPLLFSLKPEWSHTLSLKALKLLDCFKLLKLIVQPTPAASKKVMGLTFSNPIGLAAGLDKNGDYMDALGALGFGFIEIGTVTPKPQTGNSKPRLFRLTHDQAIINRMGLNNKGVDYLLHKLKQRRYSGILGINIGKNAITPLEKAIDDYRICLSKVYTHASYITVNISSPNTPGLRALQGEEYLNGLLRSLKKEQERLANDTQRYVPIIIKIAPDLEQHELNSMALAFIENKVDGVIATNTTAHRPALIHSKLAREAGGLSGQPLFAQSTAILANLKQALSSHPIPIIASGGVMSAQDAIMKINAGAELVQLYTGLIYQGLPLIASCVQMCLLSCEKKGEYFY